MKVSIKQQSPTKVVTVGVQGPAGGVQLGSASDVDLTNLQDKSLLLYDTVSSKWKASKKLEDHEMNAGHF